MRSFTRLAMVGLFFIVSTAVFAQAEKTRWEEHNTLIRQRQTIAPLDGAMFGDSVSYYTGSLGFAQTDTSIPGNNALPVAVTRTYGVTGHRNLYANLAFGDWDIELPSIGGVYAASTGWVVTIPGGYSTARCNVVRPVDPNQQSTYLRPPMVGGGLQDFHARDYWNGVQVNIPGRGTQDVLLRWTAPAFGPDIQPPTSNGDWVWLTADQTYLRCLPTIQNGAGEGFVALDNTGTTYRFDWMAATLETDLRNPGCDPFGACQGSSLVRKKYRLYATKVTDRFGNTVDYTYSNIADQPVKLTAIASSDGRNITLTYNAQGNVATVVENGRTWTYSYDYSAGSTLTSVQRPDGSSWSFDFGELSDLNLKPVPLPIGDEHFCRVPREVEVAEVVGTVTHPSGAVGEFRVAPRLFGRTEVPFVCTGWGDPYDEPHRGDPVYPMAWWSPALISKRTTGSGLSPEEWTYTYDGEYGFDEDPNGNPITASDGTWRAAVAGPGGEWTRYTFGNRFMKDEGLLLKTELGTGPTNVLRTIESTYATDPEGAYSYPYLVGYGAAPFNGSFAAEARRVMTQRATVQHDQGATFTWAANAFDMWGRQTRVTKSSTLGNTKEEITVYDDDLDAWVLGQVLSVTDPTVGPIIERTFDSLTALQLEERRFGALVEALEWNTNGTLKRVADAAGNGTGLANWHRGIPRLITRADGTTTVATVNDRGEITSITNESGFVHQYAYDDMGRMAQITYPTGGDFWAPTVFDLVKLSTGEHGLASGHWRHTITNGNARRVTYLDARWRPVLNYEYDAIDPGSTTTFVRRRFDHNNREIFTSYPSASVSYAGTDHHFDVLGRPTGTTQDSELGPLTTTVEYLVGFQRRVTNARGAATTTTFQAFDTPDESAPRDIVAPEGQSTTITRDIFGKPKTITRNGVVRQYTYDSNQRLCKRTDPETGATVVAYDLAGNVSWSASGLALPADVCEREAVAEADKSVFGYDQRNRVTSENHPGTSSDIGFGYTPTGSLALVNNGWSTWAYTYNNRGLLTHERLLHDGVERVFRHFYDMHGNLRKLWHPNEVTVNYAPDALGRPTRASGFATNAQYHPGGALGQFTYGNGIVRTIALNTRRMPQRVSDLSGGAPIHDWEYGYDANGNVAAITDYGQAGHQSRNMTYDALDRLDTATAPNMWGLADYGYDALDNLRSLSVQSGVSSRTFTYAYDAANRLSAITGSASHSFTYDARGNQISHTTGAGTQSRVFDAANRLTGIPGVAAYRYDGHGRRTSVDRQNGTEQQNIYTLDGVLRLQRDETENKVRHYVYLGSTLVARVEVPALPPTSAPVLTAPATNQTGDYTISWTSVEHASDYEWREDGGPWEPPTEALSKSFEGRENGTYSFQVRACNGAGCGPESATASTHVMLKPASSPPLNDPDDNYSGAYTFSWSAVLTANRYVLSQSHNGGTWQVLHDSGERTKAVTVTEPGVYAYHLKACHYDACAAAASAVTVTVHRPPIPTLTTPSQNYSGSFAVSWPASPGATRYVLYQRLGSGAWQNVSDGAATSKTVTVNTVGTYGFLVYACNTNLGCGTPSGVAQTVVAKPPAPTLTVPSTNTGGNYTISWSPSYGATYYIVYENFNGGSWYVIHNGGGNSRVRSGLTTGDYGYLAYACNTALGCGLPSQPRITQVTTAPTGAPTISVPSGVVYYPSPGSFTVSWTTVATATSYQLQQRKNSGAWSTVYNSTGTSTTRSGSTGHYEYRATACNVAGCGPWSAIRSVYVQQMGGCVPGQICNDPDTLPDEPPADM